MKKIKILFLLVLSGLSFISCKSDDEFYNAAYLSVPNIISIDTQPSYTLGDNLTFHAEFSRYLPETGQSNLLDVYKTSGATSFGFAYRLEKQTASGWSTVFGDDNEYTPLDVPYVAATEKYKRDYFVALTASGNYRLSFGQSYTGNLSTDIISNNPDNKTLVHITTNPIGIDSQGYYYFTVN